MHTLGVGDRVQVAEPANDFPLAEGDAPVLLLAGGIGVTPLIAMATALQAAGRAFAFHYTGRTAARMAYRESLVKHFGATLYADDDNLLNLQDLMGAHADHAVYICGPRPMIDAARAAAEAAGIAPADIHVELFTAAAPVAGDAPFEVEVSSTGQVFTVPPGKTIVEVLEEGGVDVMYDCQRGDCGICQTTVLSGTPDHRDVVLSEAERASGTVMQICVSRAKSARLVLDL
jgi:vanillate O-demethylase ferredoxin subunit